MKFVQRLFGTRNGLPSGWRQTLRGSNFFMARREVADMLHHLNEKGRSEGGQAIVKREFSEAWERFAENPCYESSVRFVEAEPSILEYFLACCPGGRLQRAAIRTATSFSIGDLSLETPISQLPGLRELSSDEYIIFPRYMNGESIYHADLVQFLGRPWEVMVSIVQGTLCKWSVSLTLGKDEDIAELGREVFRY